MSKIELTEKQLHTIQATKNPVMKKYIEDINKALEIASNSSITDEDSAAMLDAFTINAKKLYSNIDTFRKNTVKPYNDYVGNVNKIFKEILSPLEEAYKKTGKLYAQWAFEKEQAEQKALEEARKEQEKSEEVTVLPPPTEAPKKRGLRKKLAFTIEDETKVPREFCSPDQNKIKAYMGKATKPEEVAPVPGVKFYLEVIHVS